MLHITKLRSSQTSFLNMTTGSLWPNSFYSHQIAIQQSTYGMWCNARLMSWMRSRSISSSCVMLSYQHWPNCMRNVSGAFLNQHHEELKQLIKHPVRCSETLSLTLCDVRETMCDDHLGPCTNGNTKDSTNKNTEMWTKQATFKVYKTIRNIYEKKNFNIRFCFLFFSKTCHLHYPECNSLTLVVWILLCCTHRHTVCGCYKKVWSAVFTPSWCLFKWHPQSFLWS